MNNLSKPLTSRELDRLDDFLLNRVDDEENIEGENEGIVDISSLDGFFTAIISAPVVSPPSRWLPAIWGEYEPTWKNEKEFTIIFSLMMRHMNSIIDHLKNSPETFQPIFMGRTVEEKEHIIVDEWCDGYMVGTYLIYEPSQFNEEIKALISPMIMFGTETGWDALDQMGKDDIDIIRNSITPNARSIYAYWNDKRIQEVPSQETPLHFKHKKPKVSRNDPCHCGSGKKFKKCCLH